MSDKLQALCFGGDPCETGATVAHAPPMRRDLCDMIRNVLRDQEMLMRRKVKTSDFYCA